MTIYTLTPDLKLKVASFPIRIGICASCGDEALTMQCDFCGQFICSICSLQTECDKREGKLHFLDW